MSAVAHLVAAALPALPAGTTRLHIRNMVCPRCLRVVQRELEKIGLVVEAVALGAADVRTIDGGPVDTELVQDVLHTAGFALVSDPRDQLVEQVKALVVELIHYTPAALQPFQTYSHFISERLGRSYAYLSHQFSAREGLTLEKYIIRQKVERTPRWRRWPGSWATAARRTSPTSSGRSRACRPPRFSSWAPAAPAAWASTS